MKNKKKWIISILFVAIFTCGSLSATFANTSITGVLATWLSNKTDQAINEIDEEIQKEQANQTERLKAELDSSIDKFEAEMNIFIEDEKEKRISAIQAYADELIAEMDGDETERKDEIEKELEQIYTKAIQEMEQLHNAATEETGDE